MVDTVEEEGRQKKVNIDKQIHAVHEYLTGKDIRWHEFREVGVDEIWYLWYYAENMLYILRDVMTDQLWFVEARSPVKALEKFNARMTEAMEAGMYVEEDPE